MLETHSTIPKSHSTIQNSLYSSKIFDLIKFFSSYVTGIKIQLTRKLVRKKVVELEKLPYIPSTIAFSIENERNAK